MPRTCPPAKAYKSPASGYGEQGGRTDCCSAILAAKGSILIYTCPAPKQDPLEASSDVNRLLGIMVHHLVVVVLLLYGLANAVGCAPCCTCAQDMTLSHGSINSAGLIT